MKEPSDSELIQLLTALSEAGGYLQMVTAPSVVKAGLDLGFDLNNSTTYRRLSSASGYVQYRTIGNIRRFRLLAKGRELINAESYHLPSFVKPGTPWSSMKQLKQFLSRICEGELLLIDPYISEDTLDLLSEIQCPIRILTVNAGRRGKEPNFLREYQKLRKEKHDNLEVRIGKPEDLHGRYLFFGETGYVLDHSVQDWGKKPALIMPLYLGSLRQQIYGHFEQLYHDASPLV